MENSNIVAFCLRQYKYYSFLYYRDTGRLRIFSQNGKEMFPFIQGGRNCYLRICLAVKSQSWRSIAIHRIIGLGLLEVPENPECWQVIHINNKYRQNRVENLVWWTSDNKARKDETRKLLKPYKPIIQLSAKKYESPTRDYETVYQYIGKDKNVLIY